MAYRESRGQQHRMLVFISAVSVGVALIVAVQSFSRNVAEAIDNQSRKLLGADLVISSRSPFPKELDRLTNQFLLWEFSREVRFSTMGFFPESQHSRLVQVRAMEGNFPYYGQIETIPENGMEQIKNGAAQAIVEDSLLLQFGADVGDAIKIGDVTFEIGGRLKKLPGEGLIISQLAPRVIIPFNYLPETRLIQFGSRVFYRNSYKYINDYDHQSLLAQLKVLSDRFGISVETVESRKESMGNTLENLFRYMGLVGLAALLLGGIGIGSSMHVYINRKMNTIATLRCLGAKQSEVVALYLVQALALGLTGGVFGAMLGVIIQRLFPTVLKGVIPIDIALSLSWTSIGLGIIMGGITALIFSLSPLVAVRNVSPAITFRIDYQAHDRRNRLRFVTLPIIVTFISIYCIATADSWQYGVIVAVALFLSIGVMGLLAKAVIEILKLGIPRRLPYVLRQGLSNLYRPQNQTLVLVLCLGLGTFIIMTLNQSKYQLISQIKRSADDQNNPNMVLFDIQIDQQDHVRSMLSRLGLPLIQEVPIVSMRISSIKGIPVEKLRRNNPDQSAKDHIPRWTLNREYRSTYRDHLVSSEKILEGEFIGHADVDSSPVPISIDQGIAKDLRVTVGDQIVFDVQGVSLQTVIGSIRKVDWYKIQPNFFVVFPDGVLDDAPQMIVAVTRVDNSEQSAILQREMITQFPNVSSIDLTLVLDTMTEILNNITYAIEFMALFSLATGLIVLSSSIQINYLQRLKENVLLKILGASRWQILGVMITEYFTIGFLAANVGILLALCGSMALSQLVFDTQFSVNWASVAAANLTVIGLTMVVGMVNSGTLYRRPPLDVLRQEVL